MQNDKYTSASDHCLVLPLIVSGILFLGKAGFGRDGEGGWLLHVMHGIMAKHIQFIGQHNDNCLDFLLVMTQVMDHICVHFESNTGSPTTSGLKTAPTLQHKLSNDLIFRNKYILN